MRAVVTGGAGFIGSYLVESLLAQGDEVHVIDNLSTGSLANVPGAAEFYEADVRFEQASQTIAQIRPEIVYHLAAQADVQTSVRDPFLDAHVNALGTVNLLQACVKAGVSKFILASTSAVYGNLERTAIRETDPANPISFYGISKLTAENYVRIFGALFGIRYTILRYANVYGARQTPKGEGGVVALFMERFRNGLPLIVHGDGEQTRDFIYVKDVVLANLSAKRFGDGETVHISTGLPTSVNMLASELQRIHDKPLQVNYHDPRLGDIRHSCLSNSKARETLRWNARYNIREGLRETYEHLFNKRI
ncbi:UDP-glucose 4-epimerase [Paenibacillus sp. CECT 9249]|uniref:NAD-dependent epimerase/dehydratase family protein n=1 Tax=Paenibacillus sp. CECT 9249 TaxID=2845385 RepID=UPI001E3617C5|nr:NAD-dependent epimerase/dehydratase family protein [Paenibacillus sp. CECT 9249]CAH0118476.1 UDP-glucose 4-epimerase [Paenibacillus sp. CECT 9249]